MRNRQHHKLIKALSFMLIVLLLLSGCVGPNGTTEPGKATEPGQTTEQPSSEQGTSAPAEVIIRTLTDQQSEWTEGQFYPGSYEKGTRNFSYPKGYVSGTVTDVLDVDGVIYAYWNSNDTDNGGLQHMIRRISGLKEEDFALSKMPADYWLSGMAVGADSIYLLARPADTAAETLTHETELFIYSTKGEFRLQAKLAELLESNQVVDTSVNMCTDQSGALWIRLPEAQTFYCVEPDGKVQKKLAIPEEFQGMAMHGRANELLGGLKTENGFRLSKMNTETGSVEAFVIEGLPRVQHIFPGTTYDALVATEKSVYGVTLGETVEIRELLAFSDLGIDGTILKNIEDHEDGSLSMLLIARGKTEGERIALKPRTTKVREGLVLACLKKNDYIRYAVNQYNIEHPDNKITIKEYYDEYAVDTSEADALNRLNSDLMDGTAGDIVCLDGISFAGGGKALLDKGLFLDLYELMDNDPEFNKEDYFTDVFRVNETDGKLYRLVPFFSLNTKYGPIDEVGETTHTDESVLFETEPMMSLYGPEYLRTKLIHDLLVFSLGDFRDERAALYDTAQLTRYIETAGKLPDYNRDDWINLPEEYKEKCLSVWNDYLHRNIRFFYWNYSTPNMYFAFFRFASAVYGEYFPMSMHFENAEAIKKYRQSIGARVAYSGFPVKEGCGTAIIDKLTLAIPRATSSQEDAWQFLKCTLAEEYQSKKDLGFYGIPINKNVFQHYAEKMLDYENENDDPYIHQVLADTGELATEGPRAVWLVPALQQWMVDTFLDLLPNITKVDEVDPNVEAIVTGEVDKYCDGRQTAEEAARNIAERVELYRDEQ